MSIQITTPELPAAVFFSRTALHEFADDAIRYEEAVKDFVRTGDDVSLYLELSALGFDHAEIAAHVAKPGHRVTTGYF